LVQEQLFVICNELDLSDGISELFPRRSFGTMERDDTRTSTKPIFLSERYNLLAVR
jgi:hypothetical protein